MNGAQLYPRSGKKGVLGGELQKLETVHAPSTQTSSSLLLSSLELSDTMSLKYEPSYESINISAKHLTKA